jgi:hypothetical protein
VPDRLRLFPVSRTHLEALTDGIGIAQHATGARPDLSHGYCVDDVARALQVDLLHARRLGWQAVSETAWRSLAFLTAALDEETGRFRNVRHASGAWADGAGSQDSHGRAIHALGDAVAAAPTTSFREAALAPFASALPAAEGLSAIRARASVALGCDAAIRSGVRGPVARTYRVVFEGLRRDVMPCSTSSWRWPGPEVTYETALVPRALIVAGQAHGDPDAVAAGLRVLDWLIDVATAPDGHLSPVGNGWWREGAERSRYDQQPIEATSILLAAEVALEATGDARYRTAMGSAYAWFLGRNDGGITIADVVRGASRDGLTPTGPNLNEGAESTLMWLTALEHMRDHEAAPARRPAAARTPGALVRP